MKKALFIILAIFLALQIGIVLYGCAGNKSSQSPTTQMAGTSKISVVVKDAASGAKLPMTGVFVNSASLAKTSSVRASDIAGWSETKTNNMGYADVSDVSTDATVMIKIDNTAGSYEEYSKVISTGKNIGGYTIYLTTDEAVAPAHDTFYDPTATPSGGAGAVYTCKDAGTCMACGCPATGSGCGGGCGCSDPATNCGGGNCRSAAGVGDFGKCTDSGCPPGCKSCGSCGCSTAGGCGGSTNCTIASNPGGSGTGESSGACKDGACPTGCKGCGACVCSTAGGCGGAPNCTGGTAKISFEATPGASGKCSDTGCPTGCRNCGGCVCSAAGSCGGSSNCVSGGGGGGTPGGGGGSGGGTIVGCQGSSCPPSCATNPCGGCSCVAGSSSSCGSKGGKSYCMPSGGKT